MKKIMTSIATCALVLAGCSNNELLDGPGVVKQDGAIQFGVNTPITRAAELLTNAGFAKDGRKFNIVGLASETVTGAGIAGQEYFGTLGSAIPLTYSGTTKEWSYGASIFWPTQNLDFFSWYTSETVNNAVLGEPTKEGTYDRILSFPTAYAPNTDVSKQIDVLVGAGEYKKPELLNTTSTINLKHATTQVVFKAELADGSALRVDIKEVAMMNVAKEGTLKLGVTAGTENTAAPKIEWTASADRASYAIADITAVLGQGVTEVNLTNDATGTATDQKARAMLLIPQTFTAWNPSNEIIKETGELKTPAAGAYIRVKCKINSATDGSGLWLHGGSGENEYANLFIPVSSTQNVYGEWTPNRRITYVITFGDGGSGSGGGGWTGDPDKPVLTPIKLDVNVNEWDEQIVVLQSVNLSSAKAVSVASIKEQTDLFDMEVANNPAKKYVAEFKFTNNTALTDAVAINVTSLTTNNAKLNAGTVLKYVFAEAATIATTTNTISVTPPAGWEASVDGTNFAETNPLSLDGTNGTTLYLRKK